MIDMGVKVTAYFAASLDGFIAKEDGSIDWLNEASGAVPSGEDCGFQAFLDTVDVLVMGRNTFEQVSAFGEWAYGETPVVVLSSNPISSSLSVPGTVSHSSESPATLCDRLGNSGVKHIYVDGGATVRGFLSAGRLDEIIVTVIPIVLGGGISPFGELESEVVLTQLEAKVFDFGFVQIAYSVGANV